MSIVAVILALSSVSSEITDAQHKNALEYLSLHLAIRDRQQIVRVLCQRNPDILTAAIRDAVDAYTPIIRYVHQAVNLSDTLWDFEQFVTDMLKTAQPSSNKSDQKPPSVEDFVDLLHRHQKSCHKFLHQFAKNGKEMTTWWQDYVNMAAATFRQDEKPPQSESVVPDKMTTGGLQNVLEKAFTELSSTDQEAIRKELDAWKKYVDDLHDASATRIGAIIKRTRTTPFGPGAYLARWQQLLDDTAITPSAFNGDVRYGSSKSVKEEARKDINGEDPGFDSATVLEKDASNKLPDAPKVDATSSLLWPKFTEALTAS